MRAKADLNAIDFNRAPFIVIWEVTRACALACLHCRAEAIPRRHPLELTTEEGFRLMEGVASFGPPLPLLVFTGGDPLRRPDIYDLVGYACEKGLRTSLTPSGTAAVTKEKVLRLKASGLARLAVSLDGSTAEIHDAFRGVRGSYRWTMRIIESAHEAGLPIQINTTITRHNLHDLNAMIELMQRLHIVLWSVFFLVPVGRGKVEDLISADEFEAVLNDLYDLSLQVPFDIKSTEAPHLRRVILERLSQTFPEGGIPLQRSRSGRNGIGRAPFGVNDGKGFVFIDHLGEVYPSGFLPLSCGNVRRESLVEIYRHHPTFLALRDPDRLKGRCGRCEYRGICGGSRARAYALTGDYLESDPSCLYEPESARCKVQS